jgi:hypothetical protein
MAPKDGDHPDDDPLGVYRYVSPKVLDQMIEGRVDVAMAEYLKALDAPAMWESLKKHDKALFGNGRPGLLEEMAVTKPMVGKLEAHLKAFTEFEIQTKVDRQAFFLRFDKIETTVETGIEGLKKSIEPLAGLYDKLTKGAVAIGFFSFLAGGILAFLIANIGKIKEILKWLTTN